MSSVRVGREQFVRALSRVDPGLSARDFIEQSSSYVFQGGWVVTFNDEVSCRTKTDLPEEFHGAVRAKPLRGVLDAMKDDDIELVAGEKELIVRGSHKQAAVRMEREVVLPVEQVERPSRWVPIAVPEEFRDAVNLTVGAASLDDEEFIATCVNVTPDWLEACDRRQINRFRIATGVDRQFLVRAKSLAHVAGVVPTALGETDNWVHFRVKNERLVLILSCRRHLEAYRSDRITELLEFHGDRLDLPRGAKDAAKLAGTFCGDDKADKVTVYLTAGRMTVRGENAHGWATQNMELALYKGEDLSFRITPQALTNLIDKHSECEVTPDRLRVSGEKWTYMTVLSQAEPPQEAGAAAAEPEPVPDAEPEPEFTQEEE